MVLIMIIQLFLHLFNLNGFSLEFGGSAYNLRDSTNENGLDSEFHSYKTKYVLYVLKIFKVITI